MIIALPWIFIAIKDTIIVFGIVGLSHEMLTNDPMPMPELKEKQVGKKSNTINPELVAQLLEGRLQESTLTPKELTALQKSLLKAMLLMLFKGVVTVNPIISLAVLAAINKEVLEEIKELGVNYLEDTYAIINEYRTNGNNAVDDDDDDGVGWIPQVIKGGGGDKEPDKEPDKKPKNVPIYVKEIERITDTGTGQVIIEYEDGTRRICDKEDLPDDIAALAGDNNEGAGKTKIELCKNDLDALRNKWNVPETNTIAIGKTDVPDLEDITFEGGSPKVRTEAGLPDLDISMPDRTIKAPSQNPLFTRHAEEGVANEFDIAVNKLGKDPKDVTGTLYIHQSNPSGVCKKCIQGLANDTVKPGVLKQLSLKYPNLTIKVTSEIDESVKVTGRSSFTIKNGKYVD